MKISDPFCRVQRRDEGALAQLHERLVASGVTDRRGLQRVRQQGMALALKLCALLLIVAVMVAWLFPSARMVVYLAAALGATWIAAGLLKSRALLMRYENEYLTSENSVTQPAPWSPSTTAKPRPSDD